MSSIEIDVAANIAKFKAAMDKMAVEGQGLNRKLDRAFAGVRKTMQSLGTLAGVSVGGSLVVMGKQAINSADKIQKLSQRLGASSEALSQYRHVADLSGVSFDTLTMGWQRMTRRVAEAANGTGEARNALKELGINAKELKQLAPEQQFEVLADAIHGVKDPADQVRIAMKLFDSEGVSLIQTMQEGSEGIRRMREQAVNLGKSLSQDQVNAAAAANDALTNLSGAITGGITQSIVNFSDEIAVAADWLREKLPVAIDIAVNAFVPMLATFAAIKAAAVVIPAIVTTITAFSAAVTGLGVAGTATAASIGVLKGGLALLGGPAGALALAAGSIVYFANKSKQASEKSIEFSKSILAVGAAGRQLELEKVSQEYRGLLDSLKNTRAALAEMGERTAQNNFIYSQHEKRIKLLSDKISINRDAHHQVVQAMEKAKDASENLAGGLYNVGGAADETKDKFKSLKEITIDTAKSFDEFQGNLDDERVNAFNRAMNQVGAEMGETRRHTELFKEALETGAFRSMEEARQVAQKLGLDLESLGLKTKEQAGIMTDAWEQFKDRSFDALATFYRSGLDSTKSFTDSLKNFFKDMVSNILAQITKLLASNIWKKFVGWVTGNGSSGSIWSGVADAFLGTSSGGGSGGGSVTGSLVSAGSKYISNAVLGGSTASGGGATGATILAGGATAAGTAALLGTGTALASGGGVGVTAAMGSLLASSAATGAAVGTAAAATAGATAGASAGAAAAGGSAAAGASSAALTATGWGAVIVAAIALLSGNSRSPQQIGLDQLQEVDAARQAGRINQVANIRGSGVSYVGNYNEASTFLGAAHLSDAQLDRVGEILKDRNGFDQAFGVKDGILRLVDESRKFSEYHETIMTEAIAAIKEVELEFTDSERKKLSALGQTVVRVDRLYDQQANSGKSTAEKLVTAMKGAYGITEEVARNRLAEIGLSTERLGEIFTNMSGDVIEEVLGMGDQMTMTAEAIASDFDDAAQATVLRFGGLRDQIQQQFAGFSIEVPVVQRVTTQQAPATNQAAANSGDSTLDQTNKKLDQVVNTLNQAAPFIQQVAANQANSL